MLNSDLGKIFVFCTFPNAYASIIVEVLDVSIGIVSQTLSYNVDPEIYLVESCYLAFDAITIS